MSLATMRHDRLIGEYKTLQNERQKAIQSINQIEEHIVKVEADMRKLYVELLDIAKQIELEETCTS